MCVTCYWLNILYIVSVFATTVEIMQILPATDFSLRNVTVPTANDKLLRHLSFPLPRPCFQSSDRFIKTNYDALKLYENLSWYIFTYVPVLNFKVYSSDIHLHSPKQSHIFDSYGIQHHGCFAFTSKQYIGKIDYLNVDEKVTEIHSI